MSNPVQDHPSRGLTGVHLAEEEAHLGRRGCDPALMAKLKQSGVLSLEMESDTLFVLANFRGWRAGAIFACDGTSTEIKPAWGEAAFRKGEEQEIRIAIAAMARIAKANTKEVA